MEDMLKALSEYLLDSGFQDPWSRFAQLSPVSVKVSDAPEIAVAAAEFLLEGMYAHKRLSRSEERGFTAQEKATRKQERVEERDYDEFQEQRRTRRGFN
jgi:magnesium chelatase subunit I